ncbi:hypothetical protein AA0116_g9256 [Alternaria tenuissima]|nr:hypothetical protein AA0116_g9256 [Alternaria tenuissima]
MLGKAGIPGGGGGGAGGGGGGFCCQLTITNLFILLRLRYL